MSYENVIEAAEFIRTKYNRQIQTVVVLGSGLGAFAKNVENPVLIKYEEIPYFSKSTVDGHAGQLVLGEINGVSVAIQQGRFHYYEGYEMPQVIFPMRTFGILGIKNVILTNAAGSLNRELPQATLMIIRDHLNQMGVNPLRGANDERFGARFPDMTNVYDPEFQEITETFAGEIMRERFESGLENEVRKIAGRGVYCALSGPTYETPAEINLYRILGADAVGMSTVPEAIAARHQGMRVLGISCITNMAAGMSGEGINHLEVIETGEQVADVFKELLKRVIAKIG